MATIRPFTDSDHPAVAQVAVSCGQGGPVSAVDERYVAHVSGRGRLAVCEDRGSVVAYGGVIDLREATFLTDLFVVPDARGSGHGSALLEHLWGGTTSRATSSSQDPRALAAYSRFGAAPRWPLIYLEVAGASVSPAVPVVHSAAADGEAGWNLPLDTLETVRVLAGSDQAATTAVVRREGDRWTVLRASTPDPRGLAVLVADLRSRAGENGVVALAVPGPHPGFADLMSAGARIVDVDLWCATPDAEGLVDPVHELPSPGLA